MRRGLAAIPREASPNMVKGRTLAVGVGEEFLKTTAMKYSRR